MRSRGPSGLWRRPQTAVAVRSMVAADREPKASGVTARETSGGIRPWALDEPDDEHLILDGCLDIVVLTDR